MDYDQIQLHSLAMHYVGNKAHEEPLFLSQNVVELGDESLQKVLIKFFTQHFNTYECFNFAFTNGQLMHNHAYVAASGIFDAPDELLPYSIDLARHLFTNSAHPNIKSGEFYVAYMRDVMIDDELTDCIGLFKAEIKSQFLKPFRTEEGFDLMFDEGTYAGKVDKGCLIFNTDRDIGYRVVLVDNVSRGAEAKYWRENFLYVTPADNEFSQTKHLMGVTQAFVNEQMPLEFAVEPKQRLEYLDRSLDYFKNVDHYSEKDFADSVFDNLDVSSAFNNYKETYESKNDVDLSPSFHLSEQAVKKQAGKFRSVIKLDKNFHIYVHGDRSLIENGVDDQGRKYYRLFYQAES